MEFYFEEDDDFICGHIDHDRCYKKQLEWTQKINKAKLHRSRCKKMRGEHVLIEIWKTLLHSDTSMQTYDIINKTGYSYFQVKSWLDAWYKAGVITRQRIAYPTGGKKYAFFIEVKQPMPPAITLKGEPKLFSLYQYVWDAILQITCNSTEVRFDAAMIARYLKNSQGLNIDVRRIQNYLNDLLELHYLDIEGVSPDCVFNNCDEVWSPISRFQYYCCSQKLKGVFNHCDKMIGFSQARTFCRLAPYFFENNQFYDPNTRKLLLNAYSH